MSLFSSLKVTSRLYMIYAVVIFCSLVMYGLVQYFVSDSGKKTQDIFNH